MTSTDPGSVVSALCASVVAEVEVSGVTWRLFRLDPALAGEAGILLEAAATVLAGREPKSAVRVDDRRAAEIESRILCACVRAVKGPAGWEPFRLVPSAEQQDATKSLVWVGALPADTRALLLAHSLSELVKAREVLRPFRSGAPDDLLARSDGPEVLQDAR